MVSLSTRQVVKWILRNTCKSKESLTPEITLRLITERCPMWMATPDQCPLPDPYWAFYWPGGQALTRFVLDHGQLFRGHRVLDFGSGCGATSIAAIWSGADHVFVNDIDTSAILASRLNFKLNKTVHSKVTFSNLNLLQPYNEPVWEAFISVGNRYFQFIVFFSIILPMSHETAYYDEIDATHFALWREGVGWGRRQKTYVLLGDMFYDTDFAMIVFKWLQKVQSQGNVSILVGDPGRHPLADEKYRSQVGVKFEKHILHEYAALPYITKEHYGLTSLKVFHIHFL
ncbi:unnamed protein product [Toxocara canis]|uniref:ETFB lysine methyltransferase n=1 Tax=Toxocara canis TaxID=6265 RepID=A0A183V323_TOXCA|nr:unnamed protein product [Toxocara canis]